MINLDKPGKLKERNIWEIIVGFPIVLIRIILYNQFCTLCHPVLRDFKRGGLNERV